MKSKISKKNEVANANMEELCPFCHEKNWKITKLNGFECRWCKQKWEYSKYKGG